MGSSGEDPNKGIDASVGALVWVRRRNGSWWPGKILSPDELPEGSLPTPRSGTPVKLLGRADASVDWYNLEKSKRVKAFHCGEYDNCIEKVKASTASPLSKRAVKYARREDAILHALELEHARLGKDSSPTPPDDSLSIDESHSAFLPSEESDDNDEDFNSSEDDLDLALENPAKEELHNPNNSEEDEDGIKRMRGLEDIASSLKRKRSQAANFQELLKRKSRRRTLTKVLECTAMMSVPTLDNKDSVLESDESKKDSSSFIGNNSDSNGVPCEDPMKCKDSETSSEPGDLEPSRRLFDVHLVAEEKHSAGLSAIGTNAPQHIPVGSEAHNEAGSTSQWRSKGKRNSRTRKVDTDDEKYKAAPTRAKTRPVTGIEVEGFRGWSWNIPHRDSRVPHRSLPYRQSRFTVNPKYDSSDFSLGHHHNNNNNNNNNSTDSIGGSGLFDVAVEVETGYRPQRVPYISLMSKINGRPVIGHPIAIEALDDGSCDDLIDFYSSGSELEYKNVGKIYERRSARGRPPSKARSKKSGQVSKKTKKLSALTGAHRLSREEKKKPIVEKAKGPCIACVPLNVVFSRINGCLNGSVRPVPRPISTSSK